MVEDFLAFAREHGLSVQVLSRTFVLVNYGSRWEVFEYPKVGGIADEAGGFKAIVDMLRDAYWVDGYSQDEDFDEYTRNLGITDDAETAWMEWRFGWQCHTRWKGLLGKDFRLFIETALEV